MAPKGDKDKLTEILATIPPPGELLENAAQPGAIDKAGEAHSLDDCAREVLDWLADVDPAWDERLKILRDERGWGDKEVAGALIAYPLEHSLHMEIQHNPLIMDQGDEPRTRRRGPRTFNCMQCGAETPFKYAGQRELCSNRCARGYDAAQATLKETA